MSFLSLSQLRKTYADGTEAVKGIDLAVDEGQLIVLLGPSGCGKTTTLRMIAGLEIATAGRILLAGTDVTNLRPAQRDVGFVFQFYALYPHLKVFDNIAFPLVSVGTPKSEISRRINEVADRLGLGKLLRTYPRHLSGGDQQRVSLARAMVRRPRVWLMDEPLGTLDADIRLEMREFIRRQQIEMKVTTIYVTHDQEEAMSLADRIVVMNAGHILQDGSPDQVYETPADLFVANFVGSPGMNFVNGEIVGSRFRTEGSTLALSRPLRAGAATLGIRCEHLQIASVGAMRGKIALTEYLGSHRVTHVDCAFGRALVRETASGEGSVGDEIQLSLDPARLNFFDSASGRRI